MRDVRERKRGRDGAAPRIGRRRQLPDVAQPSGRHLDCHLDKAIRDLRLKDHLTIADVAAQATLSRAMLSKIENGQASTSLDTLSRIGQALGVSLSHLYRHFDIPSGGAQLVKNNQGMQVVRRGTRRGHTYHLLAYDRGPKKTFEPFLITMDDALEVCPSFEHPGTEFIYMLKGKIEYRQASTPTCCCPETRAHLSRRRPARTGAADRAPDQLSIDHRVKARRKLRITRP
jgi:transcriptional regulator with XRE-family HTH domain